VKPEAAWQQTIIDLATLYRWRIHHCRPALRASGRYSTPIQGHAGFPDLVLAKAGRVIFAELKTNAAASKLTAEQAAWRDVLLAAGAEWFCWRPRHLPEVRETLAPPPMDWQPPTDVATGGRL
jgi:hypothetical protein